MERWLPIPGFPSYEISDHGTVRRARKGHGRAPLGMIVQPKAKTKGYLYVRLVEGGKCYWPRLQGLVAITFHGPRPDGYEVSHVNGDLTDNRACNLAYETPSANNSRKREHGTALIGARNPRHRSHFVQEAVQ